MLDQLRPLLRDSLARLERIDAETSSPFAALELARVLTAHAACLQAAATALEERAHAQLGRYGAEAVERAMRLEDAELAAQEVAESFLALCRQT